MSELFADLPFNLASESSSADLTAEAEARLLALAEREARKAQTLLDLNPKCSCGYSPCWNGLDQD